MASALAAWTASGSFNRYMARSSAARRAMSKSSATTFHEFENLAVLFGEGLVLGLLRAGQNLGDRDGRHRQLQSSGLVGLE